MHYAGGFGCHIWGVTLMSLCTDRSAVNEGPNAGRVATLRCKRWSCPECAPMCRRRVVEKARDGNPNIFLTLTWNANRPEGPDEAARIMKRAWVNLRRRIERTFGIRKVPFIVVFEKTKKGMPHMHLLLRCRYIKQSWLSEQMADLIDAPVVDIRRPKTRAQVYWYVAKYLGKDLAPFKGCKRWWRSHNYEVEKEEPYRPFLFGDRIQIVNVDFYTMKARYVAGAFDIVREGRGWFEFSRRITGPPTLRVFGNALPRVEGEEQPSLLRREG